MAELASHIKGLPEESAFARSLAERQGQLPAPTARWLAELRVAHMALDVATRVNTKGNKPAPPLSHFLAVPAAVPDRPAESPKPRTLREWARALAPLGGVAPPPDEP